MNRVLFRLSLSFILAIQASCAVADGIVLRPEARLFVDQMVSKYQFNRNELITLLGQAQTRPDIIAAMTKPAEAKPWFQYRPIFINDARIQGGVEFWNKHETLLTRAQTTYGVPPEIISPKKKTRARK